jgi:hypothetical protein
MMKFRSTQKQNKFQFGCEVFSPFLSYFIDGKIKHLENKSSTLGLLVTTQFEVLASLDTELHLVLAD